MFEELTLSLKIDTKLWNQANQREEGKKRKGEGEMHIRIAQPEDVEVLFEIRTSVRENYQSREEIAELGITPESITSMLQTDCCAWIAEIENKPIAFSIANATEQTIFGLFVLPKFEGRGAGRAVMQQAEIWLWQQGAAEIWLLTGNNPQLRAYGFYLHLGWIEEGVQPSGEMKFVKRRSALTDSTDKRH